MLGTLLAGDEKSYARRVALVLRLAGWRRARVELNGFNGKGLKPRAFPCYMERHGHRCGRSVSLNYEAIQN